MYEIRENHNFNSREIYFEGKPSEEVRTALKDLKCRWNPKKGCWYGFAAEHELVKAINGAGETVVTDGYLGGGAIYGSNSGQFLYGSDLSKAIRGALKQAGIKGATVSCKTYSGGQHLYVTLKTTEKDYISKEEYTETFEIRQCGYWIQTGDGCIHRDAWYELPAEEQQEVLKKAAAYSYDVALQGQNVNENFIDSYKEFTEDFREKLNKVDAIISSYRYDESNSMVDYFNTNFYYTISTKVMKEA